jgi:tRNA dimethylallyltransferase
VPEIAALLSDEINRDEAITRAALATRQYAKRQYTWFRNQPPAGWTRVIESDNCDIEDILDILLHK